MLVNINPEWILSIRNEILTDWFKIFPFFVSDYFFITVIAIAYWLNPRNKSFLDLGWLVALSTLFNIILKNIFAISRPPTALHLLTINDGSYGFPSGDVQVAAVFWGTIFLLFKSRILKTVSVIMIINIMFSRLYLGVHSVDDVLGGLFFGILIVLIYRSKFVQAEISKWENNIKTYRYMLISLIVICLCIWRYQAFPVLVLISLGTLIGYGVAYSYFKYNNNLQLNKIEDFAWVIGDFFILFAFYKVFPILETSTLLFNITILLKYTLLPVLIYILLPWLQRKVHKKL